MLTQLSMVAIAWQDRITSQRLLRELREGARDDFALTHHSTHFLAIALTMGPEDAELLEGLSLISSEAKAERPMKALPFKTKAQRSVASLAPRAIGAGPLAWADRDCRVFEVGKRSDLSSAYPNRISIGRASNKDIVLRHATVSKFHAWFGVDEAAALYLTDAGSTNRTCVSGKPLTPRAPEPVAPGTLIRFGSVDALVMDAPTLWKLVHGARAR
jgi:FHA domain-containing protein